MSTPASLVGVLVLGVVAVICVVGVLRLASGPATDKTTTRVTSPAPAQGRASGPKVPQVTEVGTPQDSTGLSILGTIGSAAVGGIAGMLTMARSGAKTDPSREPKPEPTGTGRA